MLEEKENVLSKRLNKILETRLENDKDTIEALKQLSTFYKENTLQARRNLRSQIEKRSLNINENFLESFREVKDSFDNVYKDIEQMSRSIEDMTTRLQNTKSQTKQLLEQTSYLHEESSQNKMQQIIAEAFIKTFQLTPEELTILHGNKQTRDMLSPDIFQVLEKVKKIQGNCRVLMQSGNHTLALDIIEQMTLHEEGALERLFRWTQNYCSKVDNPDFIDLITRAMERLQEREGLFKNVLEEYCIGRRDILVGDFINALTRGGPAGKPAPIETRSHDPQIYITDMLVWLNKAIPVEKNNLELLVKCCNTTEEIKQHLSTSLANICEGVCQPLKLRIDKVITATTSASVLYAITNLIRYYKKCICKIVSGPLAEILTELQQNCEEVFLASLTQQVNNMLVRVEAPLRELNPTSAITQLLSILRDMLSTASMSEGREVDMGKIAMTILEPLLRAVNEQASRLPPTDMAVYLLNCMYAMFTCLSLYEFMDERLERLQAQSDAQIDTLTSEQASSLVANLNLGPIYTILQDNTHGPLSGIPGMEPGNLSRFLNKLEYLITSPETSLLPQINLLSSSKHKQIIQKRSFELLLAIYKQLYEGVFNPENLYENPQEILPKTPEELNNLLSKII